MLWCIACPALPLCRYQRCVKVFRAPCATQPVFWPSAHRFDLTHSPAFSGEHTRARTAQINTLWRIAARLAHARIARISATLRAPLWTQETRAHALQIKRRNGHHQEQKTRRSGRAGQKDCLLRCWMATSRERHLVELAHSGKLTVQLDVQGA